MRNQTGTPQGHGPEVGGAATHHAAVQQMRHWAAAHRLEGHWGCTGFRVDELGFSEFLPVLRSRRHFPGSRS